jgi:Uma2 family endonuclease
LPNPLSGRYENPIPQGEDALLVVELSDITLSYDRGTKLRLYAEAGGPEMRILDLGSGQPEVYREPLGGSYRRSRARSSGEPVAPLAFPDVPLEWW